MCFYISINACLLSGLYIYSILYPSWVRYGNYHVLINKHSLKRNQYDLNFSLLNTVSYFPLWQCPWGRQSVKISTDRDPRMMMSGLNILPVFKQHQSQKMTTIKLQKIKRKSYTTNAWVFLPLWMFTHLWNRVDTIAIPSYWLSSFHLFSYQSLIDCLLSE